jgi:hypothetical protein
MADDDFEFSEDFDNNGMGSPASNEPTGAQSPLGHPNHQQQQQHHQQHQQHYQQQQHAAPAPFPLSMEALRLSIEKFLLPKVEASAMSRVGAAKSMTPSHRLDDMCLKTAISDHIRTLQTIFRDPSDDMTLGKEMRVLYDELNDGTKLTTKAITTKIIDGRCKILALSRICYGDESIQMLRSCLDLANAYALQGNFEYCIL